MAKTHEFKGIIFTDIPKSIVEKLGIKPGDEVSFEEKDGVVVFSKKGIKDFGLSEKEKKFLDSLVKIKHSERKTSSLKQLILENQEEFVNLLDKKILFKYQKSGEELIGIDRNFYSKYFEQNKGKERENLVDELEEEGYLVLSDKKQIYKASKQIEESKKQVRGVMGFDKKLYLVTEKKFKEVKGKVESALSKPRSVEEAAAETGLEPELVKTVVELLKEQGELIEKRKGVYQLI